MLVNKLLSTLLLATVAAMRAAETNEYFTSIEGLESLLKTEKTLLVDMKEYIAKIKVLIGSIERDIDQIDKEHESANENTENYLSNPINSYRLIRRLHIDWPTYEGLIRQDSVEEAFLERMAAHHQNLHFPSETDVFGSVAALLRLQRIYQLDVKEMATGTLNGIKYGNEMTWQDCYMLGQQLYGMKSYNESQMWLTESMRRWRRQDYMNEPLALDFLEYTAEGLYKMGAFETAVALCQQVLAEDAQRQKASYIKNSAEKALESGYWKTPIASNDTAPGHFHQTQEYKLYEKLCREELSPTPAQLRPLRCRYVTNNQPYRLLAPFKVEEHSLDPLVLTFHDMLSDEKIHTLKELGKPLMKRSTVYRSDGHGLADYRISKNAWLEYYWHADMQQMLRDLHDVTGLDMSVCEQLQVANYGIGGQYEPHVDFLFVDAESPQYFSNRIATAIYYLSDVEQGGATAFIFLRFAVKPRKGNVLFWYNLHRSLHGDYRTKHGGCPVLKGSKWIANIWIRDTPQTLVMPCGINRDDKISLDYKLVK